MYFNGSLKLDGGGACVLFISPKGEQLKYVLQILFEVSNNEAKCEALLHGLHRAISLGIKRLLVFGDSKLVVQQVNKEWDINNKRMDDYVAEVRKLENKFARLEIHHVIRDNNVGADILSKFGSTRAQVPSDVFIQELHHPSIKKAIAETTDQVPADPGREVMMLDEGWRVKIIDYITDEKLPTNETKAVTIARRSKGYVLVGDRLCKKGSHSGVSTRRGQRAAGRNPFWGLRQSCNIKNPSR